MMRLRLVTMTALGALGLLGTGLFVPGPSAAAKAGITAINISPQIASDDDRYVAFQRRNGMPVVLDTFTRKFRTLKGALYCQPRDIGARRVLLICPHRKPRKNDTGFRARTGSVLGGKTKPLARSRMVYDAFEIGRHWVSLGGIDTQSKAPVSWYLKWRTGYLRGVWYDEAEYGLDLDRPGIRSRKVKRFEPNLKGYPNPFRGWPAVCRGSDVVVTDWRRELRLWWDANNSVRLGRGGLPRDRCDWYESLRIGQNWVTWSNGPTVHAYNFRTGQRFKRRYGKKALIAPMRDGVVVAAKVRRYGRYYTAFRVKMFRP